MVGKSSLFTILTGVHEATRMGSMEVRVGVAKVPDPRLTALAAVFQPPKITHATVEYLDTPSISKESLRDTGLLASLRVADAFAHVLRVFESDTVPHEKGNVDPVRDADDLDIELILSDLVVVEKRIERVEKDRKKQRSAELDREIDLLNRCKAALEDNRPLRTLEISAEEEKIIRGFQFLSQKPMLYVLNVGEEDAGKMHAIEEEYRTTKLASRPGTGISAICGKIEAELAELSADDAKEMMETYGLTEPGLNRLIERTYDLLGLMSFLTAGETEVRAWTIPKNCTAQKAAGAIHSDFEKKFIRAESVNWKDLVDHNGYAGLRGTPLLRLEGKEYIVEDGDVLVIRHS